MNLRSLYTTLGLFMTCAISSAAPLTGNTSKICTDYDIPVDVSTIFLNIGFSEFADNFDVVNLVFQIARRDSRDVFSPFPGTVQPFSATYTISGTFCTPVAKNGHEGTVLLATHGLGYDRSYWDPAFKPTEYSFVDYAINEGYSIFYYDRLGTGKSSKISGYREIQARTQVAILQSLTRSLKAGSYTGALGVPSKIVHIGHSFGSFVSNALIAETPALSDGVVLTGLSYGGTQNGPLLEAFGLRIAETLMPGRWPGRDSGYLALVDEFANANTFFYGESYEKDALYYAEATKQPMAIGELLTLGGLNHNASQFTGPVMMFTGEFDFVVCGGNCTGVIANQTDIYFASSSDLQVVIHPDVGHAINLSNNATGAYGAIIDYLGKNGL